MSVLGPSPDHPSYGLWNLWDMINYTAVGLVGLLKIMRQEAGIASGKLQMLVIIRQHPEIREGVPAATYLVTPGDKERLQGMAQYASHLCTQLGLQSALNRAERLQIRLSGPAINPAEIESELRVLHECLEDDLRYKYFYRYPDDKARHLVRVDAEWQAAIASFKSSEGTIKAAVDCYALGHNVACVFHCMQALESGLRALAADVGLTFDVQQWNTIIEQIESEITKLRRTLPPGVGKNERMQFLSAAAKEFFYFKDGWRNYVSHGRAAYDEHQALSVLEHTRSFMNHLAPRLSEE